MTLDVIGCCGFGVDVNSVENKGHIFTSKCREIVALLEKGQHKMSIIKMAG